MFTSSQKRVSHLKLLDAVMSALRESKPKADILVIMAVGDLHILRCCAAAKSRCIVVSSKFRMHAHMTLHHMCSNGWRLP